MREPAILLKRGRERVLRRRHPWIFSGAVGELWGEPAPGETVEVFSAEGDFLAWAAYSPQSQIRARVWSWDRQEEIEAPFLRRRLETALAGREPLLKRGETNAVRLVHAESDGLPGLVVDRYGDVLVMQCLSWGAEYWRETIADLLVELSGLPMVYERSDAEVRKLEGLPVRAGVLRDEGSGGRRVIEEHGLKFWVDIEGGHKTGFYLDQRDNRAHLRQLAAGKRVLDCFSYTGGFAMNALAGGADAVTLVEDSAEALALARENLRLNDLADDQVEFVDGDVFEVLRGYRDRRRDFDLIVLDPPKFAATKAQVGRATRGYKDINLLALKLLHPGGVLMTFSCSGGVDMDLFQKVVAGAALDAGVEAQIIARLSQAGDHPVTLNFPEGTYLKGLVCRVVGR